MHVFGERKLKSNVIRLLKKETSRCHPSQSALKTKSVASGLHSVDARRKCNKSLVQEELAASV